MKNIIFTILLLLSNFCSFSQVGIGTTNPDDGAILQLESTTGAFVPPRVTTVQMNAIPTPLDGALVFNTTNNSLYTYKNSHWSSLENNTLVVNREFANGNTALSTADNTYFDLPIGISDVIVNNTDVYNVTANGTVTILKPGNYMFSASLSSSNLPKGIHKYILALTINGTLVGYLVRGYTDLPDTNYWGTSGNIIYPVNANDVIKIRYVLNNGGTAIAAKFINIGITKLN
ncbi:hypothetical protein [Neotamlana sedimentorum]|uniref:hypothetical protein n=1 Tax=Neotamlana sedimentorum TaxID=1435349 RepID=UPI00104039D5|nr:hypothetical protein [Tamlana sedimentorum]